MKLILLIAALFIHTSSTKIQSIGDEVFSDTSYYNDLESSVLEAFGDTIYIGR